MMLAAAAGWHRPAVMGALQSVMHALQLEVGWTFLRVQAAQTHMLESLHKPACSAGRIGCK
jgi:hypothetical protein